MPKINIHPHFKIMLTDETHMWSDEIQEKAGCKLWGAYLIDTNRHVHICSVMPSYEAWWLYTVWDNPDMTEEDREELDEMIVETDCGTDVVTYFNVSSVKKWAHDFDEMEECGHDNSRTWIDNSECYDTYDDLVEAMREECHANHYV